MVGHTGVFSAVVKACETVDACLGKILEEAETSGYACMVIADHGNADYMINPDGSPNTAHSTALVPCIMAAEGFQCAVHPNLKDGKLGDIAPAILHYLGLEIPADMTGKSIL
jgi:2,3-bisphosphoglycerate-independent phosphoglycerate mutase